MNVANADSQMEIIKDEEENDNLLLSSTLTNSSILVNNEYLTTTTTATNNNSKNSNITNRPPVSSSNGKKFVRSNSEKRVEFSVGPAKNLNIIGKTRPKSALKRFNIDTHRQVDKYLFKLFFN